MESKFIDQDVDVVFLANKGIVIGSFVGRNYNKILMETGKFMDNIRVTKSGLGSGVDRMFKSSILRLTTSPIDLIHSERVPGSTFSFLAHCLGYASHASMIKTNVFLIRDANSFDNSLNSIYFKQHFAGIS